MAVNHYFEIFSNDGSTTLFTSANTVNGSTIITVTETGLTIGTETYTYSGKKKFIGVSTSASTTSPDLAIGESFDGNTAYVYIVEAEPTISGVTVEYNGSVVATIPSGNKATLPIKDLKMKSDLVVTVPEATDSPLPIEISTEAEMTALLTSGEVGGVYKYTGTTGTYENGALYVLENGTITFTVAGAEFQAEDGMTWAEWCESDYNTHGAHINLGNGAMTVWWQAQSATKFYAVSTTDSIVSENETIIADYAYTTTSVMHM